MPIEHQNRRGEMYYLHEGKSAAGKPKLFFSMKKTGASHLETIPPGHEVYESVQGQVFLRKTPPKIITDAERKIVEDGVSEHSAVRFPLIDVAKDCIVVYLPVWDEREAREHLARIGIGRQEDIDWLIRSSNYTAMMRLKLDDKKTREFIVQRFCFRGSVDDWLYIDGPDDLAKLVKKYAPHLGKESFYELSGF